MKSEIINIIVETLQSNMAEYRENFKKSTDTVSVRHLVIDNLLPDSLVFELYHQFPPLEKMRLMSNFREKKYTYKNLDKTPRLLEDITFAIQSPEVIAEVEKITGFTHQQPDPSLYAGGLSLMTRR